MKPINQIIADLVDAGFELPKGIRNQDGIPRRYYSTEWMYNEAPIPQLDALDLIAMAFARQIVTRPRRKIHGTPCIMAPPIDILTGDAEAAIEALWKAVCDG